MNTFDRDTFDVQRNKNEKVIIFFKNWSKYKFDVNNKVLCVPSNMKAKVIKRFKICPEDEDWINVQEPAITEDEFYGNWYDVLIFQRLGNSRRRYNGCICIPESRLSLLQPDFSPY
jgi:hypothetical protein